MIFDWMNDMMQSHIYMRKRHMMISIHLKRMSQHQEQIKTVPAIMYHRCYIVLVCVMIFFMSIIVIYFCTNRSLLSILSNDDTDEFLSLQFQFQQLFNRSHEEPVTSSSPQMKQFMRSIYGKSLDSVELGKRRKRHINSFVSSRILSEDMEMIISLPNLRHQSSSPYDYFDYHGSLEHLAHAELIIPMKNLSQISNVRIIIQDANISITHPVQTIREKWIKINITQYMTHFPQSFSIELDGKASSSSAFLTLYFNRNVYSRTRRDLSLSDTYPSLSSSADCQVRPYRLIFAELNWTSWIIEPTSYEMNLCSGSCSKQAQQQQQLAYFTMQTFIHSLWPKSIAAPCCRPSKFTSTILLYYNGPNLVLKRFENMRVVQCTCS